MNLASSRNDRCGREREAACSPSPCNNTCLLSLLVRRLQRKQRTPDFYRGRAGVMVRDGRTTVGETVGKKKAVIARISFLLGQFPLFKFRLRRRRRNTPLNPLALLARPADGAAAGPISWLAARMTKFSERVRPPAAAAAPDNARAFSTLTGWEKASIFFANVSCDFDDANYFGLIRLLTSH